MSEASDILPVLETLVACDTRNPPRNITAGDEVFVFIRSRLRGFETRLEDYGDGSLALLATRGAPRIVFNFHLDTVPDNDSWSRNPFRLRVDAERATGLGACDIKGALACMLAAITRKEPGDLALLVTTDEEAGASKAVAGFLATDHGFPNAIVAEPTRCKAVIAHRGITTARATFRGVPGHASSVRVHADSAVHRAVRWASGCLDVAAQWSGQEAMGLRGVPVNIGRIEGGIKPNMIAEACQALVGLRALPGQDGESMMERLIGLAADDELQEWAILFSAPSLPAPEYGQAAIDGARDLVRKLGLPQGNAVDFWSEAALFSAAGMNALVLGSGDIAQAHTADEWVALSQLAELTSIYERLIAHGN